MLSKVKEELFKVLIWLLGALGYQPKACHRCAARDKAKQLGLDKQIAALSYDPKRMFRWVLKCPGLDSFALKTAERPALSRSYGDDYGSKFMNFTLHDPVQPSQAKNVWAWWNNGDDKRDMTLQLLDGTGAVVETWEYKDCILQYANFGGVDYSVSEPVVIHCCVQYDSVELK